MDKLVSESLASFRRGLSSKDSLDVGGKYIDNPTVEDMKSLPLGIYLAKSHYKEEQLYLYIKVVNKNPLEIEMGPSWKNSKEEAKENWRDFPHNTWGKEYIENYWGKPNGGQIPVEYIERDREMEK